MFLISLLALVYKAEGYLNFEVASIKSVEFSQIERDDSVVW